MTFGHPLEQLEPRALLSAGPQMVADVNQYVLAGVNQGAGIRKVVKAGGNLFFTADDSVHGLELWRASSAGAEMVRDVIPGWPSGLSNSQVTAFGDALVFVSYNTLWRSDGTAAGTVPVKTIRTDDNPAYIGDFTVVGARLYFITDDGVHGTELWTTDGTTAGTHLVKDIGPLWGSDAGRYTPYFFGVLGETLLFAASDGTHGLELWRSDGTDAGTSLVSDINPGAGDGIPRLPLAPTSLGLRMQRVGDALYFWGDDGVHGAELWRTDGTAQGTRMVRDITPGLEGGYLRGFAAAGNTVYALVANSVHPLELWRSDGTAGGTTSLGVIPALPTYFDFPSSLTGIGDRLYFPFKSAATGTELWTSDGTPAGTHIVRDISPGVGNALNDPLSAIIRGPDGLAYFVADDGVNGSAIWKTDGTAAGTSMLPDPFPGAGNANPSQLAFDGDVLYFSATDGQHGAELWRYELPDATPPAVVASAFDYQRAPATLTFTFDEDVSASLSPACLMVRRSDDSEDLHPAAMSWDALSNRATFTFAAPLPDGDYRATLAAAEVADVAGNPLHADVVLDFFVLTGDVNRDRVVDFGDLVLVAQHYGRTASGAFSEGDVTYDGRVDFADLVLIAQRYDKNLDVPPPASVAASIRPAKPKALAPAKSPSFAVRRIARR